MVRDRFRWEARALLSLGLPMMATQFCIMAMGFIDTAMAGHYDAVDLAGVAMGGNVLWPVFMLMTGFSMALTPIVAQLRGAGRVGESGAVARQGIWIALIASVVTVAIIVEAEPLYRWAGVDAEVTRVAMGYLRAVAWGVPASLVYVTLRHVAEGLGHTRPPMLIAVAALPVNAVLNYALIFGKFGFPELGGIGCGWATAAVFWTEPLLMIFVLSRPYFRETRLIEGFEGPRWGDVIRILRIGAPIGITVFVEMALFSVVGFLVGALGVTTLAAHSIASNLGWLTYVIPMGLGSAASVRVGYFVGAGDFARARFSAVSAFGISLSYGLLVSVLLVALRHLLVNVYTNDTDVLEMAANLVLIIAAYQIMDDTQVTAGGALRGYKDTRVPMICTLLGYWVVALPLGAVLGYGWFGFSPLGVYGFWVGMTLGLALVALSMGARLWWTSRDEKLVVRLART
ncbi:MAG: MATE family efflux transporter [Deltaproteobacteria bacterium]|nr:MATE family efflux transporter [Deltaproteobacteria bacterium]MBW2419790.1 MATE family efflux transporter [Deltaproteobacteria bacterium]